MKRLHLIILFLFISIAFYSCSKTTPKKLEGNWILVEKSEYKYSFQLGTNITDSSITRVEFDGKTELTTTITPPNPVSPGYTLYDTSFYEKWELILNSDNSFEIQETYTSSGPYKTHYHDVSFGSWVLPGKDSNFKKGKRIFLTTYKWNRNWTDLWNGNQGSTSLNYSSIQNSNENFNNPILEFEITELTKDIMVWESNYQNSDGSNYPIKKEGQIKWVFKKK